MSSNMTHRSKIRIKLLSNNFSFDLILSEYKALRLIKSIISFHRLKVKQEAYNITHKKMYLKNHYHECSCYRPINVIFEKI
jgi:hypothetical protein